MSFQPHYGGALSRSQEVEALTSETSPLPSSPSLQSPSPTKALAPLVYSSQSQPDYLATHQGVVHQQQYHQACAIPALPVHPLSTITYLLDTSHNTLQNDTRHEIHQLHSHYGGLCNFDGQLRAAEYRLAQCEALNEGLNETLQEEKDKYRGQTELLSSVQSLCRCLSSDNNDLRQHQRLATKSSEDRIKRLEREQSELQAKYHALLEASHLFESNYMQVKKEKEAIKREWELMQIMNTNLLAQNRALQNIRLI